MTLLPFTDGSKRGFEESVFLNFGLQYVASEKTTVRFDAFNVLGWIDKDYNKRSEFQRTTQYRSEPAALAVSVRFSF